MSTASYGLHQLRQLNMCTLNLLGLGIIILTTVTTGIINEKKYYIHHHCYYEGGYCSWKNISCSEGTVLDIIWSRVGYSEFWAEPPHTNCSDVNQPCYVETLEPTKNCSGLSVCYLDTCSNITWQVVNCTQPHAVNYLKINYTCIPESTTSYPDFDKTTVYTTFHSGPSLITQSTTPYVPSASTTPHITTVSSTFHSDPDSTTKTTPPSVTTVYTTFHSGPSLITRETTTVTGSPTSPENGNRAALIAIIAISSAVFVVSVTLIIVFVAKKKRKNKIEPNQSVDSNQPTKEAVARRKSSTTLAKAKNNLALPVPTQTLI